MNSGGTLALGQSDGVNNLAGFTLAGGVLQTGTSLSETFGALVVTGSASAIDFLGSTATLTFASLDIGGEMVGVQRTAAIGASLVMIGFGLIAVARAQGYSIRRLHPPRRPAEPSRAR